MDERVFGPYYGTPPERRTIPNRTLADFNRPPDGRPGRKILSTRLLYGRRIRANRT